MTDKIKAGLLCLLLSMTILPLATACDDNEPKDESWRKDLFPIINYQYKDIPLPEGGPSECGLYISIVNSKKEDLLQYDSEVSVRRSDWYFEHDGKQYRLGDIITLPCSNTPVKVNGYMCLQRFLIEAVVMNFNLLKAKPIYLSMDFVWPSRGIRKHIDFYAEYNKKYMQELEDFLKSDEQSTQLVLYNRGLWVDGLSLAPDYNCNLYTLTID